ncbi:MAG TPA: PEGA domain-containing protein [bacterium]|nr:PEGA domain-containing protein [bacterium]
MRNALIILSVLALSLALVAQDRQTKLAVMEIEDKSGKLSTELLENAAEALRTEIGATNKFILISKDRQRKEMIKGQKKESWKECYDQSCRIELGQALTADRILTGIITYFGKQYTLTAELIDLAKEATIKTAKAEFDGSEEGLAEAIKSIAAQIAGKKTGGSSFKEGKIGEQVEDWEIGQGEETIVKFESEPTGATVRVDGKLLCQQTPCSKMLTQGKHEITMELENYLAKTKTGGVKKGTQISWTLEPDFGYLSVESEPAGIEVTLDGKSIGKTPINKVTLSPGPHQVETKDNCYYQTGEKFTANRGESKNIRLEVKPKEAGIKVTAQDKDGNDIEATVMVDGKEIGTAPGKWKVSVCAKEIVVKGAQGKYKEKLHLEEKQVQNILSVLKQEDGYEIFDDVVVDHKTGLMWQRSNSKELTWEASLSYCDTLELNGYSNWRLPSISELRSLIRGCSNTMTGGPCQVTDYCSSVKCLTDTCSCKAGTGSGEKGFYWQKDVWDHTASKGYGVYWSSSTLPFFTDLAWYVAFYSGNINRYGRENTYYARCVRGKP